MSWAQQEMSSIALGDERLDKRAIKLLDQMIDQPGRA